MVSNSTWGIGAGDKAMSDDTKTERKREAKAARAARRAAALRTNLHRRKAQARARRAPAEEDAGAAAVHDLTDDATGSP